MRALLLALALPGAAWGQEVVGSATVTDGDTLEIAGVRIRLHAVDAPEMGQTCTDAAGAAYPCGGRAANALDALVRGQTVRCVRTDTDRYGRTVARCRVGTTDVGASMVRSGWALAYREYGLDHVASEDAARVARLGLWGGTFTAPWDFRAAQRATPAPTPAPRPAGCCKVCSAGQPCGDTCISRDAVCASPPGCACGG